MPPPTDSNSGDASKTRADLRVMPGERVDGDRAEAHGGWTCEQCGHWCATDAEALLHSDQNGHSLSMTGTVRQRREIAQLLGLPVPGPQRVK